MGVERVHQRIAMRLEGGHILSVQRFAALSTVYRRRVDLTAIL